MVDRSLAARIHPSLLAPAGLVAGFALARSTGRREVGGALFGVVGLVCLRDWVRARGLLTGVLLAGCYGAAMAGSHPLAKRIGAWPAVGVVSAATGVASAVLTSGPRAA